MVTGSTGTPPKTKSSALAMLTGAGVCPREWHHPNLTRLRPERAVGQPFYGGAWKMRLISCLSVQGSRHSRQNDSC